MRAAAEAHRTERAALRRQLDEQAEALAAAEQVWLGARARVRARV